MDIEEARIGDCDLITVIWMSELYLSRVLPSVENKHCVWMDGRICLFVAGLCEGGLTVFFQLTCCQYVTKSYEINVAV